MAVCFIGGGVRVISMVFNATFNNISVISWQSVLLVEVLGLFLWCLMPLKDNSCINKIREIV
jgi:hypothetical protein